MSETSKQATNAGMGNVMSSIYNPEDKSITTAGFLVGKVGHKIQYNSVTSSSERYDYYDGANLLYSILITYTDSTKSQLSSAERVA
jgi:hypothetical protein